MCAWDCVHRNRTPRTVLGQRKEKGLGTLRFGWIAVCALAFLPATAWSQDVDVCSAPAAAIVDLTTTSDDIDVLTDITIGDVNSLIDITHTFQGDLEIALTSPATTAVQLHLDGGGAADDMLVTFDDEGVANGSLPFTCGCDMQPVGPGTMSDYDTESSLGLWTLDVFDDAGGDTGTLNEWCLEMFETECDISALTCESIGGDAVLTWTNVGLYDDIEISRDGAVIATIGGTDSTYTDLAPGFGTFTYSVDTITGGVACGNPRSCTVTVVCPVLAVETLTCESVDADGVLTWTNPELYDSIDIVRDGVTIATLGGTDTTYTDVAPGFATYEYEVVAITALCSTATGCTLEVVCPVPAVTDFACAVLGSAPTDITLTWTNPFAYTDITISRDGVELAVIDGAETSYTDLALGEGTYTYEVVPFESAAACDGDAVTCTVTVVPSFPVFDDCNMTAQDILDLTTITSDIDVLVDEVVNETQVIVDITHTFQGDLAIDIASPAGTSVQLMDGIVGGAADDVMAIFADSGVPTASLPLTCVCLQQPTGAGGLAVMNGESSLGLWTLTVTDDAGGDTGVLNMWCVDPQSCPTFAPSGVTCDAVGADISLTWTNESTYTDIEIFRDGALLATIDGTETSYTDLEPASGIYVYSVRGFDTATDCGANSAPCSAAIGLICADIPTPVIIPDNDLTGISADIDVVDAIELNDLRVTLDVSHTWIDNLVADLSSPAGTSVRLLSNSGGFSEDINTVFTDNGAAHDSIDFDAGLDMQPSGPGRLADFRGEDSVGLWTLDILDDDIGDEGVLNAVCLAEGCPVPAPEITCVVTGSDVSLTWTNVVSVTEITVNRDGEFVALLAGDAESYDDLGVATGISEWEVVFTDATDACSNSSFCSAAVGLFCDLSTAAFDNTAVLDTSIEVTGVTDLIDPIVSVDVTHAALDEFEIDVTSPDGTTVTVHNGLGDGFNMLVSFRDTGVAYDSLGLACDCEMQGIEPLSALAGGTPNGTWTVSFIDNVAGNDGVVNSVCVAFGDCDVLPPSGFSATTVGGDVDLAWTNDGTYDSISILRDGAELTSVAGDVDVFTDFGVPTGIATYQLRATDTVAGCDVLSTLEVAVVGDFTCDTNGGHINDTTALTSDIDVTEDVTISDPAALVDISHTFADELTVDLTSPGFTTVTLFESTVGVFGDGIDLTFGSAGVPFGAPFDEGGEMLPSGPGTIADFEGDSSLGIWTLTVTDIVPGEQGVLNAWCIDPQRCPIAAPTALDCIEVAGDVDLSWINNSTYAEVRVLRNGVEVAILDGAEETFTDVAVPAGFLTYQVLGTDAIPATCERSSDPCQVIPGFEDCSGAGEAIDSTLAPVVSTLELTGGATVTNTLALLSITHTFQADLDITLTSPDGTSVGLLMDNGGGADDVRVIISDDGVPIGSDALTCECEQQPSGPGVMADFNGGAADGTWSLEIIDDAGGDVGTLDQWCLNVESCTLVGPSDLTCDPVMAGVELNWANNDTYDEIIVQRDGADIAILGGTETTFTEDPGTGVFTYRVVGVSTTLGCDAATEACVAEIGIVCNMDGGAIDSLLAPVVSVINVSGASAPTDLSALIDISHTWIGDLEIVLENPDAVATTVVAPGLGNFDDILTTFIDTGDAYDTVAFNIGANMAPAGPGTMNDLILGTIDGDWTLTVTDGVGGDTGVLNNWCLNLGGGGMTGGGDGPFFIRGDCDGNGIVFGLLDALYLLQFSFTGGPPLVCEKAGDVDGNGVLFGLLDALYLLQFSFTGGPAPMGPFPDCGEDTDDLSAALSCDMDTCTP